MTTTGNSRFTDAVVLSCQPTTSDTFTYSNFSIAKTGTNKFLIKQDITCTDPTTRVNNYLRIRWQFTKDFKYNSENLEICTNVDWTALNITNTKIQYLNNLNNFSTKANIIIDATDNLNNNYNLSKASKNTPDFKIIYDLSRG